MGLRLMIWAKEILEVMFFTGLIGCALTVAISWVSVGRDALTTDDWEDRLGLRQRPKPEPERAPVRQPANG